MRARRKAVRFTFVLASMVSTSRSIVFQSVNGRSNFSYSKSISEVKQTDLIHTGNESTDIISRRKLLKSVLGSTTLGLASILQLSQPASAYEKVFPTELGFKEGDIDLSQMRQAKMKAKELKKQQGMDFVGQSPLIFRGPKDVFTSAMWGASLWLLGGSRSNPLVTPISNILYDETKEKWLQDRNEGLFASPPFAVLAVLGGFFFLLGIATDRLVLLLSEGEANVSLQLAAVTFIGAGSLELGRIASGEKKLTREEDSRSTELEEEFAEFAKKRLLPGGNCHRNEVVRAFRRFNAKYRQSDSVEYPLSDLEIERLLRAWNRGRANSEMSSAGFYSNLQINDQADAFGGR